MNMYQQMIRESMASAGRIGAADPRHVESWMRVEHGCLDAIPREQFIEEVLIAVTCISIAPLRDSEALAEGFGLWVFGEPGGDGMASPEFWETRSGRQFLEASIPELTRQISRLADILALAVEQMEQNAKAKDNAVNSDGKVRPGGRTERK